MQYGLNDMTEFLKREYNLSNGGIVEVNISFPVQFGEDFSSDIHIVGLGEAIRLQSVGFDTMQCVYEGMRMAGTIILESVEFRNGRLKWDARMNDEDLGLPVY